MEVPNGTAVPVPVLNTEVQLNIPQVCL